MPEDWSNIALRFATYADLVILFGVPLFAIQVLDARDHATWISRRYARLAGAAAALGLPLALLGLAGMAMEMTGAADLSALTGHVVQMVVTRTGAGIAWMVRIAALLAALLALVAMRDRPVALFTALTAAGAVALATTAWAGHGAMDDGARGDLHLAADVLHLLAAGAWAGALVAFVSMSLAPPAAADHSVAMLNRTAAGFGRLGTAIVLTLLLSGSINYVLIAGPTLDALRSTRYGHLLAAKLVVFALMLGFAGGNRFLFGPRLESAVAAGNHTGAVRILRRSLRIEACLAFVVLGLVAWLGVLSPQP